MGKQGSFKIVLFDYYGKRAASPRDLKTTITVTTFGTPDEAKDWLASKKIQSRLSVSKSRAQRITLERGQKAAQLTMTHRQGEEDVSVYLLSKEAGVLYIFVESPGITPGDTTVAVVKPKSSILPSTVRPFDSDSPPARIIPIFWQDSANQFKLDIQPAKPIIQTDQGDQVGYFKVVLKSATNELVQAPREIVVLLQVDDGNAWFDPDTLTIPEGQAISPKPTALKTRPGGTIIVSASTNRINNVSVTPVTNKPILFDRGLIPPLCLYRSSERMHTRMVWNLESRRYRRGVGSLPKMKE